MLLLTILVLCLLTAINYQFGGRAVLHPAVVFSAVWAIALSLLAASGDMFYPMLPETLAIFLFGAFAFSAGCWIAMLPVASPYLPSPVLRSSSNRIIWGLLVVVAIGAPFYYRWLSGLIAGSGKEGPFLMLVRMSTVELMGKSSAFTIFGTLADLSRIVAMMAFWESERHPKRSVFAIVIALFMSGVTGQKSGPFLLVVALICIDWLKRRRVRWKLIGVMFLIMLATATAVEFYVHVGGGSFSDNIGAVFRLFVLYGSGGLVGFDQVIRQPHIVPQFNPVHVIWLRIIRKFGANVDIPEVADFISIGPNSLQDNVYTMYWSYLDIGYAGMMAVTAATGFIVTFVYRRALGKGPLWVFLYASLLYAVAFSIFTEFFVSTIYFLFKVCAVSWLVYSLPVKWAQFRRFTEESVEADLAKAG